MTETLLTRPELAKRWGTSVWKLQQMEREDTAFPARTSAPLDRRTTRFRLKDVERYEKTKGITPITDKDS